VILESTHKKWVLSDIGPKVDYASQRIPVAETIMLFGFSRTAAERRIAHIKETYEDIALSVGAPIRVNGKGQRQLCSDLQTMLQILWMLPSNPRTIAFRVKCANDICRQMHGDPTLVAELERNRKVTLDTEGLHFHEVQENTSIKEAAVPSLPSYEQEIAIQRHQMEMEERRAQIEDRRAQIEERRAQIDERRAQTMMAIERDVHSLLAIQAQSVKDRIEILESMDLIDDRCRIALMDSVSNYDPRRYLTMCNSTQSSMARLSCAAPEVLGPQHANDGPPQVNNTPMQVSEILEFELRIPADVIRDVSKGAGKRIAQMFRDKYGDDAEFLTAQRLIDGRVREVKAYAPADIGWIKEALLEYIQEQSEQPARKKNRTHGSDE
jgi:hypothetical protein